MDGKLMKFFIADAKFENFFNPLVEDEPVNFEDLYACLTKWATSPEQLDLDYDDFAAAEAPVPKK